MIASRCPRSTRNGFTLIEVLVALLILSVGMVGASALFIEGLRLHREALHRARASGLAAEIAERLRAGEEKMPANERAVITSTRRKLPTSLHPVAIDRYVIAVPAIDTPSSGEARDFAVSTWTIDVAVR
jgi:type IV pilus modification protein PilV